RLYAVREVPTLPPVQRRLWVLSEELVLSGNPGVLNSALMDLGATVCTPKRPDCSVCCLNELCQAYREGIAETVPAKSPAKKIPHHTVAVGVIWKNGKILITRRPEKGLLGGLWEFPGGKQKEGETPEEAVVREIREELNLSVSVEDLIRVVRHAYTHFKITLHAFHCRYQGGRIKTELPYRWISPDELNHHHFPSANRKIIEALY
ncbi:MAG: NUDIX domain-containing protein, partial [Nitrospirae bacterium]|nr:NUDIX domain-containing protein [Nitrospirota bacterium]